MIGAGTVERREIDRFCIPVKESAFPAQGSKSGIGIRGIGGNPGTAPARFDRHRPYPNQFGRVSKIRQIDPAP